MIGFKQEGASHVQSRVSWDSQDDEGSSKKSAEDGLECPVCWEGFNSGDNLPYVLWCGHSLCKSCVMGLQWAVVKLPVVPVQLPLFISCPWCQIFSCRLVWKGRLRYPCKNFFLLWMVENARGDVRHCHDGPRFEERPSMGDAVMVTRQSIFEHQGSRHHSGNADLSYPHSIRQFSSSSNSNLRGQPASDVFFLRRWFNNVVSICAHLMAKVMLLVLVIFILFYVLPFSTVILVVYFVATLIFAFPSFLMIYFAFPSLGWLLREIVT